MSNTRAACCQQVQIHRIRRKVLSVISVDSFLFSSKNLKTWRNLTKFSLDFCPVCVSIFFSIYLCLCCFRPSLSYYLLLLSVILLSILLLSFFTLPLLVFTLSVALTVILSFFHSISLSIIPFSPLLVFLPLSLSIYLLLIIE